MKRRWLFLSLALASLPAARARAELDDDEDDTAFRLERPHLWRVEGDLTPLFYPGAIDGNITQVPGFSNNAGPFQDIFGTKNRLHTTLEVDWDFWNKFGTLGVGAALSYAEFYGTGYHLESAGSGSTPPTYVRSGDGTSFHLAYLRLLATYHFDIFIPKGFPVVPFAKVGLDWVVYWNQLSSGDLTPNQSGGGSAVGLVTGVEASAGLAFLLDIVDPVIARDMYRDLGIAHTYLNASYVIQDIENGPSNVLHAIFTGGKSPPATLNLSSNYFDFGLELEF